MMNEMMDSILAELIERRTELTKVPIESIYFGGGTPSLLSETELQRFIETVYHYYEVKTTAEITLEVNPDDVSANKAQSWLHIGINRISLGVQSFNPNLLLLMNRSHSALQAKCAVYDLAEQGFESISIDLMYGLPGLSVAEWQDTLMHAVAMPVQHISAYCLTVEPHTALHHFVRHKKVTIPDDEVSAQQFELMSKTLIQHGFLHYEISNFGLPGCEAKHNSSYWQSKPYLGVGPSAHSYDGKNTRRWNVASNAGYIKLRSQGESYWQTEHLNTKDRYNECIMTGLRTHWGVNTNQFDEAMNMLLKQAWPKLMQFEKQGKIYMHNGYILLAPAYRFMADGIASELFV